MVFSIFAKIDALIGKNVSRETATQTEERRKMTYVITAHKLDGTQIKSIVLQGYDLSSAKREGTRWAKQFATGTVLKVQFGSSVVAIKEIGKWKDIL